MAQGAVSLTREQAALIPQYVEITNLIAKKAVALQGQATKTAEDTGVITKAANELSQVMVTNQEIDEHQQKKAEELLGTHTGTLSVLKNALGKIAELKEEVTKAQAKVGAAVPPDFGSKQDAKKAYNSLESNYVGQKTSMLKESDRVLIEKLGLASRIQVGA